MPISLPLQQRTADSAREMHKQIKLSGHSARQQTSFRVEKRHKPHSLLSGIRIGVLELDDWVALNIKGARLWMRRI